MEIILLWSGIVDDRLPRRHDLALRQLRHRLGLRRYGFKAQAAQVAGILEAAEFFDGRLPEAFGGYPRSMTKYPVQYPTACSPQAWSTGAPLLLLATMLGLEPVGQWALAHCPTARPA
jgi:glycogen debranching enzyme